MTHVGQKLALRLVGDFGSNLGRAQFIEGLGKLLGVLFLNVAGRLQLRRLAL
jgi:hypothetical protein